MYSTVCGGDFRSTFSVSAAASVRMESWNAQRIVVNWYSSYRTVFIFIIADVSRIFTLNCRHLHLVTSLKCKSLWASCVSQTTQLTFTCALWADGWLLSSGCRNGKVCVHCVEHQVDTARKTCDSLSKPTVRRKMVVARWRTLVIIEKRCFLFLLRTLPWAVTAAATAHTTTTKTTEETACPPETAPACTAGKSFTLVRASAPTAKPGLHHSTSSSSAFSSSFSCSSWGAAKALIAFALLRQHLRSGSVALQRWALRREMSRVRKRPLPDLWFQMVSLWRTLSVHIGGGETTTRMLFVPLTTVLRGVWGWVI